MWQTVHCVLVARATVENQKVHARMAKTPRLTNEDRVRGAAGAVGNFFIIKKGRAFLSKGLRNGDLESRLKIPAAGRIGCQGSGGLQPPRAMGRAP